MQKSLIFYVNFESKTVKLCNLRPNQHFFENLDDSYIPLVYQKLNK